VAVQVQFVGCGLHGTGSREFMKSEAMYDIFMRFPDGAPLWLEAVEGLDRARKRLASLASTSDAEYFIYSEKSGGIVERNPDVDSVPREKAEHGSSYARAGVRVHH
jgi:hypothetical protein